MGISMFSDVSQSEPEKKKKERKGLSIGPITPKPIKEKSPKPVKTKEKSKPKPVIKPKKKSTKSSIKNATKSFKAYSYFRNEKFRPDELEVKSSKYLKTIIRLVNRKNKNASVVLHRPDDLMSDINDIILDLEFDMSEDLIDDSEGYINTEKGTISVI